MKYTERFFSFPVRIYDRYTAELAESLEKTKNTPMEGDWAAGWAKVPFDEISSWSDYYDSVQGVQGVKDKGFEFTLIFTWNMGAYICIWEKEKFEKKLDEYVEKYEKWRAEETEFLLEKLRTLNPEVDDEIHKQGE